MRRRGVTLIEAVLYIAIALALIIGGLVFYQQASVAQKTSEGVRMLSALVSEARIQLATTKGFAVGMNPAAMNRYLVNAGAVPAQYVKDTTSVQNGFPLAGNLINPWGGQVWIGTPVSGVFIVQIFDVPSAACARLIATDVNPNAVNSNTTGNNQTFGSVSLVKVFPPGNFSPNIVNQTGRNFSASQAANACRYGTAAYGNQTGTYNGNAPALDKVNIELYLAI